MFEVITLAQTGARRREFCEENIENEMLVYTKYLRTRNFSAF